MSSFFAEGDNNFFNFKTYQRKYLITTTAIIILVLPTILYTAYKLNSLTSYYNHYGLWSILSKLSNSAQVTTVVTAKDDFLYTMQVSVLDSSSKEPISNIKLLLNGNVENSKDFFTSSVTDSKGYAKFNIQKGTFRLSIDPDTLPKKYEQVSSFFYDIQKPGTTIVKVELKQKQTNSQEGLAEIEFLDKAGNPIPGILLYLDTKSPISNNETIRYNSISNSNGIAIFKLEKGIYKISVSDKILDTYKIINPIEIEILPQKTNKYTFQVIKK